MNSSTNIPMQTRFQGTPVVPGVALGPVLVAAAEVSPSAIHRYRQRPPQDLDSALAEFDAAASAVADAMELRARSATGPLADVLRATAALARDKGLRRAFAKHHQTGEGSLHAVNATVEQFSAMFAAMGGLMAERVTDLQDIGNRITARLVGEPEPGVPTPRTPSILIAEDLAPSDTALLDPSLVLALVTEKGGPTSHTAIIARQLGIPCVVAMPNATTLPNNTRALVNGSTGVLDAAPDEEAAASLMRADQDRRTAAAQWSGPGATRDGTRVRILANVGDGDTARHAASGPVEGIGLFRTELCFLNTYEEPSVEEQAAAYGEVLEAFGDRPVVVRTLDAGSDKPIAYATRPGEANPALGVRGLRLTYGGSQLIHRQIEAIALAARRTGTAPRVMAPMVATREEAAEFAAVVRAHDLIPGVMVEIPAAALMAEQLLEVVDFLSVGTNDLAQYTMAADRLVPDLAHLTDPWQPAVLRLVSLTASAGLRAEKPVGVCGEAAADPDLAAVLVGMGVTSLSAAHSAVRLVGARLALVTVDQCRAAAEAALASPDPHSARAAARAALGDEPSPTPREVALR